MNDEQLTGRLAALGDDAAFRALHEQLGEFDPFKVLKVERYELRHTTTLSWLLDPQQTHGLGDSFLRAFLHEVFGATPDAAHIPGAAASLADRVAVHAELRLGEAAQAGPDADAEGERARKRKTGELDVLVESEAWAVAVEAKIDSKEGLRQLRDYGDTLQRRFAGRQAFRLRMLYLTVQEEPEVVARNPGWIGIQWGHQVARALAAALARRYGADPHTALAACSAQERTLCEFLYRYMALLQRLANALYGLEDAVQAVANRHNQALLALREGVRGLEEAGVSIVPWLRAPAWVKPYWEYRQALDVLMTRARAPEADFTASVFRRLVAPRAAGVALLSAEHGKRATIRFIPREWEDWKVEAGGRAIPLQGLMFYHMAFRNAQRDIELKLFLPDGGEHALQAVLAQQAARLGAQRGDGHIAPTRGDLAGFLAKDNGEFKLYTLRLRWLREGDDIRLAPGAEERCAAFWRAVDAHTEVLRDILRRFAEDAAAVAEIRATGGAGLGDPLQAWAASSRLAASAE